MTLDDFPKNDLGHHMGVVKATGERVRVLCVDAPSLWPIVVLSKKGAAGSYDVANVIPAPRRREYWINEYPDGKAAIHTTVTAADRYACPDRIGPAKHVVFEE